MNAVALRERHVIGYRRNGDPIYAIAGGAVTAFVYHKHSIQVYNKLVDIDSDTMKAMLTTSSYTPSKTAHDFKDDVTNEVTGTGYSAGGTTLTTSTSAYDGSSIWNWDADDASWASSSITARNCVTYDSTPGTDATRPLISYVDFGGDNTTSSGTFSVVWAAGGIIKITWS